MWWNVRWATWLINNMHSCSSVVIGSLVGHFLPRHLALRLLGVRVWRCWAQPYGWGGLDGPASCPGFTHSVDLLSRRYVPGPSSVSSWSLLSPLCWAPPPPLTGRQLKRTRAHVSPHVYERVHYYYITNYITAPYIYNCFFLTYITLKLR